MPEVPLGFNSGSVLWHLSRHTYTNLARVVIECVQNAIDAEADNVWIKVDMRRRDITVSNDGKGVDLEQFERALTSVGQGVKSEDKLGRFGLGLISPLDKCAYFTFTSKPAGEQVWYRWTFKAESIKAQSGEVLIPLQRVSSAKMGGQRNAVSVLSIHSFTKDQAISTLEPNSLVTMIQEKLGPALRKFGVTCHLEFKRGDDSKIEDTIRPQEYTGEPLEVYRYEDSDAGTVEFELYRAVRTSTGHNGQVVLSEFESTYPVTWKEFVRQTVKDDLLNVEPRNALASGCFEGIIRAEGLELHPSRAKFVYDDSVAGVCTAIEEWFIDVGRKIYDEERKGVSERRYQDLGLRTLSRLSDLLNDPQFEHLRTALQSLDRGSIGTGHIVPKDKVTSQETTPGKRVGVSGAGKPKTSDGKAPLGSKTEKSERPGDVPLVAHGPDGRKRQVVQHNSGGLAFSHAMPEGSEGLWELDSLQGVIYFNVRHPVWMLVDDKDERVMHLQEWITIQALSMMLQPDSTHTLHRDFVDAQARMYVELIIVGAHKRSRRATKSRTT